MPTTETQPTSGSPALLLLFPEARVAVSAISELVGRELDASRAFSVELEHVRADGVVHDGSGIKVVPDDETAWLNIVQAHVTLTVDDFGEFSDALYELERWAAKLVPFGLVGILSTHGGRVLSADRLQALAGGDRGAKFAWLMRHRRLPDEAVRAALGTDGQGFVTIGTEAFGWPRIAVLFPSRAEFRAGGAALTMLLEEFVVSPPDVGQAGKLRGLPYEVQEPSPDLGFGTPFVQVAITGAPVPAAEELGVGWVGLAFVVADSDGVATESEKLAARRALLSIEADELSAHLSEALARFDAHWREASLLGPRACARNAMVALALAVDVLGAEAASEFRAVGVEVMRAVSCADRNAFGVRRATRKQTAVMRVLIGNLDKVPGVGGLS